ncbi:MAG: argininosuccinate lyase [Proteobacteria bacterium]|nr:argininosuccinate lyase [Pseudomonadota bacterium]
MTRKPWQGRFSGKTSNILERFSQSISFDRELFPQDIRGSIAHARMLGERGIIPKEDAAVIMDGLEKILADLEKGSQPWREDLEDVHMNIEALLGERVGEAAGRLHTGRSRNDQVALDFKLYVRETSGHVARDLLKLLEVLLKRAEEHFGILMPGYTHTQRAQPVLLSHHLMAYFEMFRRDHAEFAFLPANMEECPLGSGALAGAGFPIDRMMTARELGFSTVTRNSMDAVSDRDFAARFLFNAALCQIHLSRMAEEIVIWATSEFGFVTLPDAFSTGSSMMPQKKNPDPAELVRGKTGRTIGNLMSLLATLKGLPLTYNRDLQEDKEPLFDSAKTLLGSIEIMAGLMDSIGFNTRRLTEAAEDPLMLATDLADYLTLKGLPFRNAHEVTGKLVALCVERGCGLAALSLEEMRKHSGLIGEDIFGLLTPEASVAKRDIPGGTAPGQVRSAMEKAREWLETARRG